MGNEMNLFLYQIGPFSQPGARTRYCHSQVPEPGTIFTARCQVLLWQRRIRWVALLARKTVRFSERSFLVVITLDLILICNSSLNFQLFSTHLLEITGFGSPWLGCVSLLCVHKMTSGKSY